MAARVAQHWLMLTVLCLAFGLAGWLLAFYQASPVIWVLIELMVSYLAWVGTGAIALASVGAIAMVWIATLLTPQPEPLIGISLTPAQTWALGLILSLTLALSLVFGLAFSTRYLNLANFPPKQTFQILIVLANIGLVGGTLINIALSKG